MEALRVLLADDNESMRTIVTEILKATGVRHVKAVEDGAAALVALRTFEADLAVVDFNMKPIDGVTFTKLLRRGSDSPNPYLPVIMMTGHAEKNRVYEARDAGVNEFIAKPITARALLARFQAVILKPRAFVRAQAYVGPDRRRAPQPDYLGPFRRESDRRRSDA